MVGTKHWYIDLSARKSEGSGKRGRRGGGGGGGERGMRSEMSCNLFRLLSPVVNLHDYNHVSSKSKPDRRTRDNTVGFVKRLMAQILFVIFHGK